MDKATESADLPASNGMFCKSCRYDLRGLSEPRCPECGRPFDPEDASTFFREPPPPERIALVLTVIVAAYPIVALVTIYGTWFAACFVLDEHPKRSDGPWPTQVGGIITSFYRLTAPCLGYGFCLLFCLACLLILYHLLRCLSDFSEEQLVYWQAMRRALLIFFAWAVLGGVGYCRPISWPVGW